MVFTLWQRQHSTELTSCPQNSVSITGALAFRPYTEIYKRKNSKTVTDFAWNLKSATYVRISQLVARLSTSRQVGFALTVPSCNQV